MEKNRFNPTQLKKARISRGYTRNDLARETGISRQTVSNYELGKTNPKGESLLKIINALNFPRSFFLDNSKKTLLRGPAFFRSQAAATKRTRDMQETKLNFLNDIYDVLKKYVNFPSLNLPDLIYQDPIDITDEYIKEEAKKLRIFWGLNNSDPINNIINLVEANGIIISEANMTDNKLDAVSEFIEDKPYIMLTDNGESSVRRRFNVAHELGHIILHNGVESIHDYTYSEQKNIIEYQANLFASSFLMPDDAFKKTLVSVSLEFYIDLKKYWKTSIQSMIYKTSKLDLISEDQKLYLNKKISWNKWRKVEPLDDVLVIEKPELFNTIFNMIVDNGVVDKNELVRSFNLPKDELEKIFNMKFNDVPRMEFPKLRLIK